VDQLIHIGKVVATFGLTGQVIITHVLAKKVIFKNQEPVFIEITKGKPIPFFVETCTAKSISEITLKLEGVSSRESAIRMINKNIWINEAEFNKMVDKSAPIALIGYTIYDDENEKVLGVINEMIEQPHQLLAKIYIDNKEVLIPLNESTLLEIDRKKKEVVVDLPEGLLDIYLK